MSLDDVLTDAEIKQIARAAAMAERGVDEKELAHIIAWARHVRIEQAILENVLLNDITVEWDAKAKECRFRASQTR